MILDYLIVALAAATRAWKRLPHWAGWVLVLALYAVIFLLIWGTVASR